MKPSNKSAVCGYLLDGNFLPLFDNFSILDHENKKYLVEIEKGLPVMRDKLSLNINIKSALLYLFGKVY